MKAHDVDQVMVIVSRRLVPSMPSVEGLTAIDAGEMKRVYDSAPLGYVPGKDDERLACRTLAERGLIAERREVGPGLAYYVRDRSTR